jgi:hypothetical protein
MQKPDADFHFIVGLIVSYLLIAIVIANVIF